MGTGNVDIAAADAEKMPFLDDSFDLIVANNGINNVKHPALAIKECSRVARFGAQLVITMNLQSTMVEFYEPFREVLKELGDDGAKDRIDEHINLKRLPIEKMKRLLNEADFKLMGIERDTFTLDFVDGSAMLRHHFIKCHFLSPWKEIVGEGGVDRVFGMLEEKLNKKAKEHGLRLTVPYACIDCKRK